MNVRTNRITKRQTDEIHRYHVYVGLAPIILMKKAAHKPVVLTSKQK